MDQHSAIEKLRASLDHARYLVDKAATCADPSDSQALLALVVAELAGIRNFTIQSLVSWQDIHTAADKLEKVSKRDSN